MKKPRFAATFAALVLDGGASAPWEAAAKEWWDGKNLQQIGQTRWTFDVRRK